MATTSILDMLMEMLTTGGLGGLMDNPTIAGFIQSRLQGVIAGSSGIPFSALTSPMTNSGGAYNMYQEVAGAVRNSAVSSYVQSKTKTQLHNFGISLAQSLYSRESYNPAKHGGMSYDTYIGTKAIGMAANPILSTLYSRFDPNGGVAYANAQGALYSKVLDAGRFYENPYQYVNAKKVADNLFMDRSGRDMYASKDYGGMSKTAATYVASELIGDGEVMNGLDTTDPNQLDSVLQKLRKKIKDTTKALSPLKDIYGDDLPKMFKDLQSITNMPLKSIGTASLARLSSELASRQLSGSYDLTQVFQGKQAIDAQLAAIGYKGTNGNFTGTQSMAMLDATNRQEGMWSMTPEQQQRLANSNVINAYNSSGADLMEMAYAVYKERGLVNSVDEFEALFSGSANPLQDMVKYAQAKGVENLNSISDFKQGQYLQDTYLEAKSAGVGGRIAMSANMEKQAQRAVRQLSLDTTYQTMYDNLSGERSTRESRTDTLNNTLTLLTLAPELASMSQEERKNYLSSPEFANRKFVDSQGKVITAQSLYGTESFSEAEAMHVNMAISALQSTEAGRTAMSNSLQAASENKTRAAARTQQEQSRILTAINNQLPGSVSEYMGLQGDDLTRVVSSGGIARAENMQAAVTAAVSNSELSPILGDVAGALAFRQSGALAKEIRDATSDKERNRFVDPSVGFFSGLFGGKNTEGWQRESQARASQIQAKYNEELAADLATMNSSEFLGSESAVKAAKRLSELQQNLKGTEAWGNYSAATQELERLEKVKANGYVDLEGNAIDKGALDAQIEHVSKMRRQAHDALGEMDLFNQYETQIDVVKGIARGMRSGLTAEDIDAQNAGKNITWDNLEVNYSQEAKNARKEAEDAAEEKEEAQEDWWERRAELEEEMYGDDWEDRANKMTNEERDNAVKRYLLEKSKGNDKRSRKDLAMMENALSKAERAEAANVRAKGLEKLADDEFVKIREKLGRNQGDASELSSAERELLQRNNMLNEDGTVRVGDLNARIQGKASREGVEDFKYSNDSVRTKILNNIDQSKMSSADQLGAAGLVNKFYDWSAAEGRAADAEAWKEFQETDIGKEALTQPGAQAGLSFLGPEIEKAASKEEEKPKTVEELLQGILESLQKLTGESDGFFAKTVKTLFPRAGAFI